MIIFLFIWGQKKQEQQKMSHRLKSELSCSPITPSQFLQEPVEESDRNEIDSSLIKRLDFLEEKHGSQEEQILSQSLENKRQRITELKSKLRQAQLSILNISKYHEEFIDLHDDRRNIEKEIIDEEFQLLKLERESDVLKRNRSAVSIVEVDEPEGLDDDEEVVVIRNRGNYTIKEVSEEMEDSLGLRMSQSKRMNYSGGSAKADRILVESCLFTASAKKTKPENPEQKVVHPRYEQVKQSTKAKGTPALPPKSKRPSYPGYSPSASSLHTFARKPLSPSLQSAYSSSRRLSSVSSDQFYRSSLQWSMYQDLMTSDYLAKRYLH